MARLVMSESKAKQYDLLDEDSIHECTVKSIEQSTYQDPVNGPRENLNWTFLIHTPGEWDGKRIWGNTSMLFNTNANCKLRNWAQSVLATELDSGFELDTDDLVGRQVRVVVAHRKKADGTVKQVVSDLMPTRKSAAAAANEWDDAPF